MSTRPRIISISIQVNRLDKRLEGNVRRQAGLGSSAGRVNREVGKG
jgi:hypothetical protein